MLESGLKCAADKPDGPAFTAFRLKSRKAGSFRNRRIEAGKAGNMVRLSGLKAGKAGNFRKRKTEIEKAGKFISFLYKMHPC